MKPDGPQPGPDRPPPARRAPLRRALGGAAAAAALIGAVIAGMLLWRGPAPATTPPPPPDPRTTYAGPFLNVRPEVRYVGDDRCADCHPDVAASYRKHPMARSLRPIARVAPRNPTTPRSTTRLRRSGAASRPSLLWQGLETMPQQGCGTGGPVSAPTADRSSRTCWTSITSSAPASTAIPTWPTAAVTCFKRRSAGSPPPYPPPPGGG